MASKRKHTALTFDQAIDRIHADAIAVASKHLDSEDIAGSIAVPDGPWTADQRRTLAAARTYYVRSAETYHDHPVPFGAARSNPEAWWHYASDGISTGTVRDRLSELPRAMRDLLQEARCSGSAVLLPHAAPGDDTPLHLRLEYLMRRFCVDASVAEDLANAFDHLDADARMVEEYAQLAKKVGWSAVWLELRRWTAVALEFEIDSQDILEEPEADRTTEELLEALDHPEQASEKGPHISIQSYFDDNPDPEAALLDGEFEDVELVAALDEDCPGFNPELVQYHRTGRGDCEPDDGLDSDPLVLKVRSAKPEQIAQLKKEIYELQRRYASLRPSAHWGYLWHLVISRENTLARTSAHLTRALHELEQARTHRQLARLGREAFSASKRWPSFERKRFWAAYNRRKAEYAPAMVA